MVSNVNLIIKKNQIDKCVKTSFVVVVGKTITLTLRIGKSMEEHPNTDSSLNIMQLAL